MNLIAKNIRARDIVTRKSLENAARVVACTGGSTNAGLHLPAMAHEAGIRFDLFDVCEVFRSTRLSAPSIRIPAMPLPLTVQSTTCERS